MLSKTSLDFLSALLHYLFTALPSGVSKQLHNRTGNIAASLIKEISKDRSEICFFLDRAMCIRFAFEGRAFLNDVCLPVLEQAGLYVD